LYNPTISGLSDDTIRFFLLHEEGHHINGHFGYSLRGVFCLLGFILFVVGLFGSMSVKLNPFFYVVLCIIGIALVVFAFLGLKNLLKNDEYNSDIFAAMKLRDTYQKEDPPTIVKNGFIELENHFVNCNFGEHPLNKIENWSYDITEYHPTNVQRIESIKKSINKK
jgi:Zn-dependent protease with chaperone function